MIMGTETTTVTTMARRITTTTATIMAKRIVTITAERPSDRAIRFVDKAPERFSLGVGVDPRRLMKGLWEMEAIARNHPTVCAKVVPFASDIPPSDAVYYPLYTKCVELDLPVSEPIRAVVEEALRAKESSISAADSVFKS